MPDIESGFSSSERCDIHDDAQNPCRSCKEMPLKRIETKLSLVRDVAKAIKEAEKSGIRNAAGLVKKALDSRANYKVWKQRKTK